MLPHRIDPPYAADEASMLRAFLDYLRQTLRRQVAGLDAEQLAATLPPSTMTLGGMVRHLTSVEDHWFQEVLAGDETIEPWASVDWDADPDWDWHDAHGWEPAALDDALVAAIARADARLDATLAADPDLSQLAVSGRSPSETPTLRWILVHMVEEYARHCGHADLLREAIDGERDR